MTPPIAMSMQRVWCWRGWRFHFYALPQEGDGTVAHPDLAHPDLPALMKLHAKARVMAVVDPDEASGRAFVIGSGSSSGGVRIQTWWWTLEGHLHRDAVFVWPGRQGFERLAYWDIASAGEAAIIGCEITGALHARTN